MADCFIRVYENNYTSIWAAAILKFLHFDVLVVQVAVYLADEILTIAKYIHTATCNSCDLLYGRKLLAS